jgi:YggT family protein
VSHTVLGYINTLLFVYSWVIIGRVLLSWIPSQAPVFRSIYGFFYTVTEPYLGLFRRIIPTLGSGGVGIDVSPIVALFVLYLVQRLVSGL